MVDNYYTLRHVASTLHSRLSGKTVTELFSQEKNELALKFSGLDGSLILSCNPDASTMYFSPGHARAKQNSVGLFPACRGEKVSSVSMHPSDRIVVFDLASGLSLVARFFHAHSNVLLVDRRGDIVDSFKDSRKLVGIPYREMHAGSTELAPSLETTLDHEHTSTVGSVVKRSCPALGMELALEAFHRAKITKDTRIADLGESEKQGLVRAIATILSDLSTPSPCVYTLPAEQAVRGRAPLLSLIRLRRLDRFPKKAFAEIHDAIGYTLSRRQALHELFLSKQRVVTALRKHMEKQRRSLRAIESDLRKCSRADEYEEFGSLLISNLDSIARGSQLVDLSNGSRTITIQLDGRLSPGQNAQRYFAKAKASRLAQHESGARAKALRTDIEAEQHLLDTLEATTDLKELRHFLAKHGSKISRLGIGVDGRPREPLPFRVFMVDGGFQVWAGKNSSNNDLLTTKYAKPNDLWFHVRGTGGSHVILKRDTGRGEPDKKARMEAASIAAYYSTMRNAAAVPVAMTEKKYVRKPKGAPAGTVVIERETVLFVQPGLPQAGESLRGKTIHP